MGASGRARGAALLTLVAMSACAPTGEDPARVAQAFAEAIDSGDGPRSPAWALPDFWSRTLQNWQSEFLAVLSMAVLSMVVLSIYLRERGSPESKPVGAPHDATGIES